VLRSDGRITLAELARRVHVTAPTVAERLQRLEAAGVIRGYHADIDPTALGYALSAIVRVRPAPRQLHKVAELLPRLPEVVEAHRVTGEDCFLAKAHVRDVNHLEALIDQLAIYGQTTTSIIQSSPVPARGPAVEPD
jgi:Lrp/AsnC family leucine-responsive transcriptional regulator